MFANDPALRPKLSESSPKGRGFPVRSVLFLVFTTCATMHPLARSDGLKQSAEGVLFSVVGQTCKQSSEANQSGKAVFNAAFAIEVGNPVLDGLSVHRGRFRFKTFDGSVFRAQVPDDAFESISVEPGTTAHFELRVIARGSCSQEMQLVPEGAIEWEGHAIEIEAVRFVPVAPP